MNKIINPPKSEWLTLLQRPTQTIEAIETTVTSIFDDVKRNGDDGIKRYTSIFDGVDLDEMYVSDKEFLAAEKDISTELKEAIALAKRNIEKFHSAQKTYKVIVETIEGVECWQEKRPIQKVGLYIPGGTAPLFSSVLMLAIPAQIAGCNEIILATPPNKKGKVNSAIIYAAQLCGVTKILKVGGIQAIAGLTF